mmetsp:Transcript_4522/g.9500  ORF Transcript_4522/g.9500 Transcript_4522/m.9500 type:complete len:81 (+) Transcript_4522:233-475(+)
MGFTTSFGVIFGVPWRNHRKISTRGQDRDRNLVQNMPPTRTELKDSDLGFLVAALYIHLKRRAVAVMFAPFASVVSVVGG